VTGAELVFYFLSTVAVLMAAGVVLARNPIHSAFFLVISFLNVAGTPARSWSSSSS
jgi:NADH-quinone oxidoreductase subunit J